MTYSDCYKFLTSDDIYEGLLGFGLFSDRLPPFLSSKNFFDYQKQHPFSDDKFESDFIIFENMRNTNVPRVLGIPTPFAYANQCKCISDNWNEIQDYFISRTSNQEYKVSRIHIRKLAKTKALFKMNYDNWKIDGFPEPDLVISSKYKVKADISNCFPSMYSHAICWAILGKSVSQDRSRQKNWTDKLDSFTNKLKNKETHGFLIGPHSSNLLSEIILSEIDNQMIMKKWKFIRKIDDYVCYVDSYQEAEQFFLDLRTELRKFDLLLNDRKSSIVKLPLSTEEEWVRKLASNNLILNTHPTYIGYTEISNYLNSVISLFKANDSNSSILSYSLKILAGIKKNKKGPKFSANAVTYLKKMIQHYALLYPYLIQFLEEYLITVFDFSKEEILVFCKNLYSYGINSKNFETITYSLYFSIKNQTEILNLDFNFILNSGDCILLTIFYEYAKYFNRFDYILGIQDFVLEENKKTTFDRFWLLFYEVLPESQLIGPWKQIKSNNVTFIDKTKLVWQ